MVADSGRQTVCTKRFRSMKQSMDVTKVESNTAQQKTLRLRKKCKKTLATFGTNNFMKSTLVISQTFYDKVIV